MYHVSFQFAYSVDGFEPSRRTSKLYKERVSRGTAWIAKPWPIICHGMLEPRHALSYLTLSWIRWQTMVSNCPFLYATLTKQQSSGIRKLHNNPQGDYTHQRSDCMQKIDGAPKLFQALRNVCHKPAYKNWCACTSSNVKCIQHVYNGIRQKSGVFNKILRQSRKLTQTVSSLVANHLLWCGSAPESQNSGIYFAF